MVETYKWMAVSLHGMNLDQLNKKTGRNGISLDDTIDIGIQIL